LKVWKELNHHNPSLAVELRDLPEAEAVARMRQHILASSQRAFLGSYDERVMETDMEQRLAANP
jgi:hypothetical protein